MKNDKVGRF